MSSLCSTLPVVDPGIKIDIEQMVITTVDSLTRRSAAALIGGYQKHISPKKGFSCAYRVLHKSQSCSEFIKRTILERGLIEAIPAAQHRLQACKAANQVLKSKMETQRRQGERNSDWANNRCLACTENSCEAIGCGFEAWDGCAGCSEVDCGILNCSGLNCSFLDCGSCGG